MESQLLEHGATFVGSDGLDRGRVGVGPCRSTESLALRISLTHQTHMEKTSVLCGLHSDMDGCEIFYIA